MNHIELGEAGADIGFDDLNRSKNRYAWKVVEDEQYFDSDDPGSDLNNTDEQCGSDEVLARRQSVRVQYDPNSQIPLFEIGTVFDNVIQFSHAIAKYAILRGVQLTLKPNEVGRVKARCKADGYKWCI